MQKVGLDKLQVMVVFRRILAGKVDEDAVIRSVAQAVGEAIEQNNKKLLADLRLLQKEQ
jgi:hypothetical protein